MAVSVQPRAPAVLPPVKVFTVPIVWDVGWAPQPIWTNHYNGLYMAGSQV
jgi:hypothetical protein